MRILNGEGVSLNNYNYDTEQILRCVRVINHYGDNDPSIGVALKHLSNVASWPKGELEGDIDGIDALAYHLSEDTCDKAIEALQIVKARFEEYRITKEERTDQRLVEMQKSS